MSEHHITISAHVVVQLGEELVTDIEQALLELAKNAYDADSYSCDIEINPNWSPSADDAVVNHLLEGREDATSPPGRIRIRDTGTGISETAVDGKWLKISSSAKRAAYGGVKEKTPGGRTPVGDKGLGRLATMKIGHILRLKTATEGETQWRTVTFSWRDFTIDKTLDQIEVNIGVDDSEPVDEPGTIVEIIDIKNKKDFSNCDYIEKKLVPNLSALVSPFKIDDDFRVSIAFGSTSYSLHYLDKSVLNLASAKFVFTWDGGNFVKKTYIAASLFAGAKSAENDDYFKELLREDNLQKFVNWLRNDKKVSSKGLKLTAESPWILEFEEIVLAPDMPQHKSLIGAVNPGPVFGEFYYFLYTSALDSKLVNSGVTKKSLQEMSQVAIFRDGFRVRADRDWLKLSAEQTSGTSYYSIRPSNVVGYFMVTNGENPYLIEKSDREGFVDNPAYRGLLSIGYASRDHANALLEAVRVSEKKFRIQNRVTVDDDVPLTKLRVVDQQSENATRTEAVIKDIEKISSAISAKLPITDGQKAFSPGELEEISRLTVHLTRASQDAIRYTLERKGLDKLSLALQEDDEDFSYRLLDAAAVGLAARSLTHELNTYVRQLKDSYFSISSETKPLGNKKINSSLAQLNSVSRELLKTISTIDPLLPGSRTLKESISINEFLTGFVSAREAAGYRYSISIRLECPAGIESLKIRFGRARFLQILENLFQNSMYWLRRGPLPDGKSLNIVVTLTETGFTWQDSGPGITPSLEASIFDPYVSGKPRDEASGLGLHIITTFLELEKCSVRLLPWKNSLGRKFAFDVNLTGAVVQSKII